MAAIDAPVRVRSRMDEGPTGDGVPPAPGRGQRIMAVVVALGVFAAAGAFAFRALTPGDAGLRTGSGEPAPALQVRCTENGLELLTPVVAAQPDGLHVDPRVSGLRDPEISLGSVAEPGREWWSGSSGVDGPFVRTVPVGEAIVHCESGPEQGDGPESFEASFEIIDPAGVYVSTRLPCEPATQQGLSPDSPSVQADSIEEAVRAGVEGVLPTDVVEQAGYLGSESPWLVVRVVREGLVVAAIDVDGRGYWRYRAIGGRTCPAALGPLIPAPRSTWLEQD